MEVLIAGLQRRIEQAAHADVSLDAIETEIINPAPVDEEEHAALWLYAEALCTRRAQSIHELLLPLG